MPRGKKNLFDELAELEAQHEAAVRGEVEKKPDFEMPKPEPAKIPEPAKMLEEAKIPPAVPAGVIPGTQGKGKNQGEELEQELVKLEKILPQVLKAEETRKALWEDSREAMTYDFRSYVQLVYDQVGTLQTDIKRYQEVIKNLQYELEKSGFFSFEKKKQLQRDLGSTKENLASAQSRLGPAQEKMSQLKTAQELLSQYPPSQTIQKRIHALIVQIDKLKNS